MSRKINPDLIKAVIDSMQQENIGAKTACEKHKVAHATFWYCLKHDKSLLDYYHNAKELQADARAEQIVDLALEKPVDKLDVLDKKNKLDALKWDAAVRKPRKYGNKLDINVQGKLETKVVYPVLAKEIPHEVIQDKKSPTKLDKPK